MDGLEVLRHIFPDHAIAPGGALKQHAIPVIQCHGKAVDLDFHRILGIGVFFFDLSVKLPQLLIREHILQALHGVIVLHLLERIQRLAAHPLGGGIRPGKLGVLGFQRPQLSGKLVVFKIRQFRRVLHIVFVGVIDQLIRQLVDFFLYAHGCSPCVVFGMALLPAV